METKFYFLLFLSISLLGCKEGDKTSLNSPEISMTDLMVDETIPFGPSANEDRYAWQKPSLVINKLGDISEKVIADIGAGTGYFTFRLLQNAKKVIAIDIDPNMINLIEIFRHNLDSIQQLKIEPRLATPESSNLQNEEVDVIVIINTIGYIEDRAAYLKNLNEKIKVGGELMIVDFKMKRIPDNIAPPTEFRVNLLELEDLLVENGYQLIESDDRSLDYQYIVKAQKL